MTPGEFKALFPTLNALDLPSRPVDQVVDRAIHLADKVDPALADRFGKVRKGQAVIWDDRGQILKEGEDADE